jgi:pilus assembly protein CpaF
VIQVCRYGSAFQKGDAKVLDDLHQGQVNDTELFDKLGLEIAASFDVENLRQMPRGDLASKLREISANILVRDGIVLNRLEQRNLVTKLVNGLAASADKVEVAGVIPSTAQGNPEGAEVSSELALSANCLDDLNDPTFDLPPDINTDLGSDPLSVDIFAEPHGSTPESQDSSPIDAAKIRVQPVLLERIDVATATQMPRVDLARQVTEVVGEILFEERLRLNLAEQRDLVTKLINDMLGLGPLEPLLEDESITDILVNGPNQVYIERKGKLVLTDVKFRDNQHVMNIATRIVTKIGRRVDETSPLVDARLEDGSRVNIIIPPLAIDGASISIRKFSKKGITLDVMSSQSNISAGMATVLKVASRSRLNILISGGTGSGKTTLLNAMSQLIDHGERIVTIEDAAELQLQQPHIVRLETRPANLEGDGEITMRDLVKNALRMRPDRIILGEVRGHEAIDMLQAMNTGHDGSMCTVHANRPREALTRLENMVGMAGINLPSKAVRTQIADAIDLIVQVSRMRDGMRRVTSITEVTGMEGDVLITQEIYNYEFEGEDNNGQLIGHFKSSGLRPAFAEKAEYFGLDKTLLAAV